MESYFIDLMAKIFSILNALKAIIGLMFSNANFYLISVDNQISLRTVTTEDSKEC